MEMVAGSVPDITAVMGGVLSSIQAAQFHATSHCLSELELLHFRQPTSG